MADPHALTAGEGVGGGTFPGEAAASPPDETYKHWLEGNRLLFLKADRRATLVCMTLEDFITIIGGKR